MKRIAALVIAIVGCNITGPTPERVFTAQVSHSSQDCMSWVYPMPCLQVQESADAAPYGLMETIEGFSFEWGHRYRLEIARYVIDNPPQDASNRRYELRRIIDDVEIPAGTQFNYVALPESRSILRTDTERVRLFGDQLVRCGEDCAAIGNAIDAGHRFTLKLEHTGNSEQPLALVGWSSCVATTNLFQCDG